MKRRNPAFIILIFLFWYYSTIRERKKPLLQDIFHKVRVTNLTQGGLKAMEELAKLEAERGTPGYATDGKGILADERKGQNRAGKNGGELSVVTSGKSGRIASNEMCTFLILNISSLQLIPVNMIAYRQQYGSVNPAGIIAPAIVATAVSTGVAVVYCKVRGRR
jgi:spore maturation protein A